MNNIVWYMHTAVHKPTVEIVIVGRKKIDINFMFL